MLTRDVQELRALLEESGRETRLKRIRELEAENKRLEYRVEQLEGELVEVKQDWSVLRDKLLSLGYMRG